MPATTQIAIRAAPTAYQNLRGRRPLLSRAGPDGAAGDPQPDPGAARVGGAIHAGAGSGDPTAGGLTAAGSPIGGSSEDMVSFRSERIAQSIGPPVHFAGEAGAEGISRAGSDGGHHDDRPPAVDFDRRVDGYRAD